MTRQHSGTNIDLKADILNMRHEPFGLIESSNRGIRLSAVNEAAKRLGVHPGDALADARAVLPRLAVTNAQPYADKAALRKLARWCGRYGILRNAYGFRAEGKLSHPLRCYGVWIDISGVSHLYGGEMELMLDLERRFARFGITARTAVADTLGAAHALACYGTDADLNRVIQSPVGGLLESIAHLPVAALRLDHALVQLVTRFGFKHIGALAGLPRIALERRFRTHEEGQRVLRRLDQALGLRAEPRRSLVEAPAISVQQLFADPLITSDVFQSEVERLINEFCRKLEGASLAAKAVRVGYFRCDGTVGDIVVSFNRAATNPNHICRLIQQKMVNVDLGYGVDLLSIEAVSLEKQIELQRSLVGDGEQTRSGLNSQFIDRLTNRLGKTSVTQLCPYPSHWPERSEFRVPTFELFEKQETISRIYNPKASSRPLLLLEYPERIVVASVIPEGAPVRFTWRRVVYSVVRFAGPERIEAEWWRNLQHHKNHHTRDYYTVEDDEGARLWVFCADYHKTISNWFVHGIFS
jgi:protein ImuB